MPTADHRRVVSVHTRPGCDVPNNSTTRNLMTVRTCFVSSSFIWKIKVLFLRGSHSFRGYEPGVTEGWEESGPQFY